MGAIATFLGAAGFKGFKNWVWIAGIAGLIALVWIGISIADRWHENSLQTAAQGGAATAIITGQNQTLDQLGDANDAEAELETGGERSADRYAECLQSARTPANCERYNPEQGQ